MVLSFDWVIRHVLVSRHLRNISSARADACSSRRVTKNLFFTGSSSRRWLISPAGMFSCIFIELLTQFYLLKCQQSSFHCFKELHNLQEIHVFRVLCGFWAHWFHTSLVTAFPSHECPFNSVKCGKVSSPNRRSCRGLCLWRIQMITGTAIAILPTSASFCMIFLIRLWE